jgi:glycerophosphoryl diester phosphodiesterase
MWRIGHRGAKGYEPENTLLSFSKALQLNVDMIELDVHVCKTGDVVVIHDETVEGTTNGTGRVADMTLDDLRKLNADKGQRIPTLQEVLDLVDRRAKVNIELKEEGSVRPVFELFEKYVTERGWSRNDFLISSFKRKHLQQFRKLSKEYRLGVLIEKASNRKGLLKFAEEIGAYSINVYFKSVSSGLIDDAHERGIRVIVWTVDNKDVIQRMKLLQVDGIISNYPDRL